MASTCCSSDTALATTCVPVCRACPCILSVSFFVVRQYSRSVAVVGLAISTAGSGQRQPLTDSSEQAASLCATSLRNWVSGFESLQVRHFHIPPRVSSGGWMQVANDQGTNLRYPVEVTIDVHHTHVMVKRSLGDEEIRDGRPVPHTVMMHEVLLEPAGAALHFPRVRPPVSRCCRPRRPWSTVGRTLAPS
jgi:hypothetical protein